MKKQLKNQKQIAGEMAALTPIEDVCAKYGVSKVYAAKCFFNVLGFAYTK